MQKKKVLVVNESHLLGSGYGTYCNQMLLGLHKLGKYELAEFAIYGFVEDAELSNVPWKVYPNAVKEHDKRFHYYIDGRGQFGEWRFESVVLDFKPDYILDIRDIYMMDFENSSVLRDFYSLIQMPTVDSAPQKFDWIEQFANADSILTYTEFGKETLEKEGGGKINVVGVGSCGVDVGTFRPYYPKDKIKEACGISKDSYIVGTVMRNQPRKLYPDLFESFRIFLDNCKNIDLKDNTYLYIHSSFPDVGWGFDELVSTFGLHSKVLFTYYCNRCKSCFPSFFNDIRTNCIHCNDFTAMMPSTKNSPNKEQLAKIYNCFDLYVQMVTNEGFGIPVIEAASCGVPICATNYSSLPEIIRNTDGYPIKIDRMFLEHNLNAYRAYPSKEHTAQIIEEFLSLPYSVRSYKGFNARLGVLKNYTWEKVIKNWENAIDNANPAKRKWDEPPKFLSTYPPDKIELLNNLTNSEFINELISKYLKNTDFLDCYEAAKYLAQINTKVVMEGNIRSKVSRESILQQINDRINKYNKCEEIRCGFAFQSDEDYLNFGFGK